VVKAAITIGAVGALALLGCVSDPVADSDRPPPEVGGRFAVGGFSFGGPDQPYGYEGELSAEERELRERARRFEMTVWQGALLGGLAGTLIGAVAGGDVEDAAGGAMLGGTVGAIAGFYVAAKQEQYADAEDQLESMTADVRASNREAEALIASARSVLAEDRRRLAAVEAGYRRGEASEQALRQERARVWGNRKVIEQAAVDAGDRYRVFDIAGERVRRDDAAAAGAGGFDVALEEYRRNIEALDAIAGSLTRA
jgi:hypothetical protein